MKRLIYDIETLKFLSEVHNQYEELCFVVGATLDYDSNDYKIFTNPKEMYYELYYADEIYGFNNLSFDNEYFSKFCCDYFNPTLLNKQVIKYGKYKDMTWEEVPDDYLDWMINENVKLKTALSLKRFRNKELFENTQQDTYIKDLLDNKSKDLFKIIKDKTELEYPVDLSTLSYLTINKHKLDNIKNNDIPRLVNEGKINLVAKYVVYDCILTKQLFKFVEKNKYVLIPQIKKFKKYEDLVIRVAIDNI